MDEEIEKWAAGIGTARCLDLWTWYHVRMAWLEATRRADRRAREECCRIIEEKVRWIDGLPAIMAIRDTIPEE